MNYKEIEPHSERVSNIIPFITKYNCKGTNYPSKMDDWKTFEKNNSWIALNILYTKVKYVCPASNSTCQKQIILVMNLKEEKKDGIILQ